MKRKISKKMLHKAYYLEEYDSIDMKDEESDTMVTNENQLSDDFYRVMGKILTFVEQADQ